MMRKFDYAVFDLDGTLLDTREGVIAAAVYTINKYGKSVPNKNVLENLIGPPMQDSFRVLFNLSSNDAMEMANSFRDTYQSDEYLFNAIPYEGIYELMESLEKQGVKIGVATYKREDYAKRLLYEKEFDIYTEYMYGADFEGRLKKEDIIRNCLNDMGCIDYSNAVYIGDGVSDGKGAILAGIPFIAVTYGFGFKSKDDTIDFNPVGVADCCNRVGTFILD